MASHGIPRLAASEQKTEQTRLKEQRQIEAYKELVEQIEAKAAQHEYTLETLDLTSKLLRQNPEYNTIWNVRRRLLIYGLFSKSSPSSPPPSSSWSTSQISTATASSDESSSSAAPSLAQTSSPAETPHNPASQNHGKNGKNGTTLDFIKADLDFLFPLMVQYPKCYWIWNYRFWLLQQANERLGVEVAKELWSREFALVGKMLTRDSRNFHGWGYRRKVVAQLESPQLNGHSMVESEFEYTTKMIRVSLSNFSAWHHRSKMIPRLLNERSADDNERRQFLDDEFDLITQAIYTDAFPYAQSVWFYHQFLMTTLIENGGHLLITPNFSKQDRIDYVAVQLANVKEMLDGAEDCKWIYNALLEYTLAGCEMEGRVPGEEESSDCRAWLVGLRKLDPERNGRWDDISRSLEPEGLDT